MTDTQPLKNHVVCVTGSARRVGRAVLLAFARAGANVVVHHHNSDAEAEATADAARQFGVEALIVMADLSNPEEIATLFERIHQHYNHLDILVNSAANYKKKPLLRIPYEEWQSVLNVNLTAPFLCTQHAGSLMLAQKSGGVIINIADNSGLNPFKSRPHHSISKAGVIMLTRASALSLGEYNIRVNCIVSGPVLQGQESDVNWEKLGESLPLKRTGTPEAIGDACVFLATTDFATGAILHIDGGENLT